MPAGPASGPTGGSMFGKLELLEEQQKQRGTDPRPTE